MKFLYCFFYISVISLTYAQPDITAFINGKIYTVNEKQPLAEAVVIQGNKILFVGTNDDYAKHVNNESVIIDLQGKLMLPGFIDNHTHFISGGFYLNGIDLRSAKTTTEFINLIKDYAELNPGKWITGGNWDHEAWEKKVYPCKEWIDEFTPNTPVFVDRFDGHMGIANSYALKLAGITKETESPAGGFIEKDPITGEPTGILKDNAMSLVYRVVPDGSDDDYYQAGLTALDEAKSLGVTSIQDITYSKDLEIYKKLESENKLTCRIYTRTPLYDYKSLVKENIKVGTGNSYLKMGGLKAFADGSLGSSSALFFEPYENEPENCGLAMEILSNGNLKKWAMEADKNNLQICVHAIGDSANSEMLSIYEEIVKTNPEWDRRFRIEHSQHVRFEDIDRFAKLGVIASVQPYHCIDDGVWAEKRIGKERIKYTYPFRTFLDKGVHLCFGSDWTVAPLNPILGIYAAVTRRTLDGKNPGGWLPEQKLTVEEAVKCYTINNAYASFDEKVKGSIEPGKLADLVVLSDDIFTIAPENIRNVKVIMTIFDGKVIYQVNK
ncbi:MAG TPA: amidohydrolase [Ignavibacteriaceae bacterium]|nr:amidohydrolase [Ignavibacteriaceae bacterium]